MKSLMILMPAFFAFAFVGCGEDHKDHKHGEAAADGQKPAGTAPVADTAVKGKARDPVCGIAIDVQGKSDSVYRDTRFYFCSANCLDKFKAAPSKATTGLPKESCMCSAGEMKNCKCGHCTGKPERCECGDPKDGGDGHDHKDH